MFHVPLCPSFVLGCALVESWVMLHLRSHSLLRFRSLSCSRSLCCPCSLFCVRLLLCARPLLCSRSLYCAGQEKPLCVLEFPLRWSSCALVVLCPLRRMRVASPHRMLKCVIEFFGSRETLGVLEFAWAKRNRARCCIIDLPGSKETALASLISLGQEKPRSHSFVSGPRGTHAVCVFNCCLCQVMSSFVQS